LVTIPIQVFNAVEADSQISFKQLHKEDKGKINYKKICSSCDKEVAISDIVKGYEYEADQYVVITPAELENIKLKSSKAIDIEAFVDIADVHPSRFEAAYFVGPHGDIAQATFNLLVKTLQKSGKAGVGKIILREREDVVIIVPEGNALMMYKLRYKDEVRLAKDVPDIKDVKIDDAQLQLAETLVTSLTKRFDDLVFEDKYKEALEKIVQSKVAGKEVITIGNEEPSAPVIDIMDALKKSIEEAQKARKGA
jgi:DNA end-binding protein Ku